MQHLEVVGGSEQHREMRNRRGKSKESRGLVSYVSDEIQKGKYRRLKEEIYWRIFKDLKSMKPRH